MDDATAPNLLDYRPVATAIQIAPMENGLRVTIPGSPEWRAVYVRKLLLVIGFTIASWVVITRVARRIWPDTAFDWMMAILVSAVPMGLPRNFSASKQQILELTHPKN